MYNINYCIVELGSYNTLNKIIDNTLLDLEKILLDKNIIICKKGIITGDVFSVLIFSLLLLVL